MGIFDELIKVDDNGVVSYVGWVEWKHVTMGLLHCPVCLVLDKCWFNNALKPQMPQHEKCHCIANNISKPIPNISAKAKCDLRKFMITSLVKNMLGMVKRIYLSCLDLQKKILSI